MVMYRELPRHCEGNDQPMEIDGRMANLVERLDRVQLTAEQPRHDRNSLVGLTASTDEIRAARGRVSPPRHKRNVGSTEQPERQTPARRSSSPASLARGWPNWANHDIKVHANLTTQTYYPNEGR